MGEVSTDTWGGWGWWRLQLLYGGQGIVHIPVNIYRPEGLRMRSWDLSVRWGQGIHKHHPVTIIIADTNLVTEIKRQINNQKKTKKKKKNAPISFSSVNMDQN